MQCAVSWLFVNLFPRCASINAAMAQVGDVGEEVVLRLSKSKGLDLELLPRSKPDGKVTHTRVVVGGRWKTAPKDGDGAATLPSEEGTFDQFVTWFDKDFAISPGTTPSVKWRVGLHWRTTTRQRPTIWTMLGSSTSTSGPGGL